MVNIYIVIDQIIGARLIPDGEHIRKMYLILV